MVHLAEVLWKPDAHGFDGPHATRADAGGAPRRWQLLLDVQFGPNRAIVESPQDAHVSHGWMDSGDP